MTSYNSISRAQFLAQVSAALALLALPASAQTAQPAAASPPAAGLTLDAILKEVERQMTFRTRSANVEMRIMTPGETRKKQMRVVSRGEEDALILLTAPERDSGTKFLRLGDQLWTYLQRQEKTVKISGHMLRLPLLGSDYSHEDMTENRHLTSVYDVRQLPDETLDGEAVYVLKYTQKSKGSAYPERTQWISKRHLVPLREARMALGGSLLKLMTYSEIKKIGDRYYPTRMSLQNKHTTGTQTDLILKDVKFDGDVPDTVFNLRNLTNQIAF
jgi:outer membrane lipoprotein-sorting protein